MQFTTAETKPWWADLLSFCTTTRWRWALHNARARVTLVRRPLPSPTRATRTLLIMMAVWLVPHRADSLSSSTIWP